MGAVSRLAPFLTFVALSSQGLTGSFFEEGSHCVAYRAEKVMFFFLSRSEVVGRSCDVSAQVLPEVGGLYHVEVNVPVRSLTSGDSERDTDVVKALKGDERQDLTFRTPAKTAEQWRTLFASGEFDIVGDLSLGNSSFPVKLRSRYIRKGSDHDEVDGVANVTFKDFGMDPPRVAGGLVARAKPDLQLHFHLQTQRILGADAIRLPPREGKEK